jgi:hypothetical protein
MYIASALRTDRMYKSLTGLTVSEFKALIPNFSWNYKEIHCKEKGGKTQKDRRRS